MIEIIDQATLGIPDDQLYKIDHDYWIAQEAFRLGFAIGGFVCDIYENAVILLPPIFRYDWSQKRVKVGRVITVNPITHLDYPILSFVLLYEDGTQVPMTLGIDNVCFFALPDSDVAKFLNQIHP